MAKAKNNKKATDKKNRRDVDVPADPSATPSPSDEAKASSPGSSDETEAAPSERMRRKEYERELRRLHGELVAMQEWVKATGAKVCIVFEGRDTAGKGGTIKRDHRAGQPARVPGRRAPRARPTARSRRCTSSATSRTSPPPARS